VDKFVEYFLKHLILDFEGALDCKGLRDLLDDSTDSVNLLSKIQTDADLDDFILALTDGLKDYLAEGIDDELILREFKEFADS
jgi:hypothetical protein